MSRTRIKICGLTREDDVEAAVAAGADAIGLVFYPPSPRAVTPELAAQLCRAIPPFVTVVGLFVNASRDDVARVCGRVPVQLLQFHGDENEADCLGHGLPYMRAVRMRAGVDLLNSAADFPSAAAILADAYAEGYGGSGKTFDWSLIPARCAFPLVLSGGLDPDNVAEAVRSIRPYAVDVSSGVEVSKGIKDADKIKRFIAGVRHADV